MLVVKNIYSYSDNKFQFISTGNELLWPSLLRLIALQPHLTTTNNTDNILFIWKSRIITKISNALIGSEKRRKLAMETVGKTYNAVGISCRCNGCGLAKN